MNLTRLGNPEDEECGRYTVDTDVTDAMVSLIDGLEIKRRAKTVTGCMEIGSAVDPELLIPDPTSEKFLFRSQIRIRTIISKVFLKINMLCVSSSVFLKINSVIGTLFKKKKIVSFIFSLM
jgi:hypothetical protein